MLTTPADSIAVTIDPYFSGLYVLQRDFQARLLGDHPVNLDGPAKMAYIREMAYALTDELHEATAETGWKSWATSNHINRPAYTGEMADVFIFMMNLLLVADITPTELMDAVRKKISKNHKRQDDGYDGVTTKCPQCKRAYDDEAVKCYPVGTLFGGYAATKPGCELNK
jgi:NTP pyrophosphatase (non-canonical NTP hydrolase)